MVRSDDLGHPYAGPATVSRVVSLVPSITEAVAMDRPEALVGATDWCTHPADLAVTRVRGTKNPDLQAIRRLAPQLVIANKEENRALDVARLREAGIPVWVTDVESVPQALESLGRLYAEALGWGRPDWLSEASEMWSRPVGRQRGRVAVPIWRDPWMVVGARTYADDLITRLGWRNVFSSSADRYPKVDLGDLDRPDIDVVLLPDEPYRFSAEDGPEAFAEVETRLVSGRLLTWYGPAMVEAHRALSW
ncbi:helical backbone metal receptor [soil metagenome]